MARPALVGLTFVATWLAGVLVMRSVVVGTAELWRGSPGEPHTLLLALLAAAFVLPTGAAAFGASWLSRRLLDGATRARVKGVWQRAAWPVLAGYVVTAAFGSPAVHNSLAHSMVAAWAKRDLASVGCLPELETYFAVPLLPGIILSYAEATAICEGGGGSFLVYFWNGRTARRLAMFNVWAAP